MAVSIKSVTIRQQLFMLSPYPLKKESLSRFIVAS